MARRLRILVALLVTMPSAVLAQNDLPLARAAALAEHHARAPDEPPEALAALTPAAHTIGRTAAMGASSDATVALEQEIEAWSRALEQSAGVALLGIPTRGERNHAALAALSVLRLGAAAEDMIPRVLGASSDSNVDRAMSGELLHSLRVVLPLRCGRALVVLSGLVPPDDREARINLARAALELVRPVEEASEWSTSERSLLIAHALRLMVENEESARRFEEIRQQESDLPEFFRDRLAIESSSGEARAEHRALTDPPALASRRWTDADLRLLRADVAMRGALERASIAPNETERTSELVRGVKEYELARIATDGTAQGPGVRTMVYEKLGAVIQSGWDLESMPVVVQVAQVMHGASSAGPDVQAERAAALRNRAEIDESIPEPVARDVEWVLAGDSWEAMIEFAEAHPGDDRAVEAYLRAHSIAQNALALWSISAAGVNGRHLGLLPLYAAIDDSGIEIPGRDEIRLEIGQLVETYGGDERTIGRALAFVRRVADPRHAVRRRVIESELLHSNIENGNVNSTGDFVVVMHERIDRDELRDRLEGGSDDSDRERALLFELARIEHEAGRLQQAIAALDQMIGAMALSSQAWLDQVAAKEQKLGLLTKLGDSQSAVLLIEDLQSDERTSASHPARCLGLSDIAWATVEPLTWRFLGDTGTLIEARDAELIAQAHELAGADAPRALSLRLGWARLLGGDPADGRELLVMAGPSGLRGLGEVNLLLGDDEGAFSSFKALASMAPTDSRDHIHAWVRMLEILERQNVDGSRTVRIRRELMRVHMLPGASQFADCQQRLARIRERLAD